MHLWNALLLTVEIVEISWHIIIIIILCGDWFHILYLLIFPVNKSHKVLIQGNVGAKDHALLCSHQKPLAQPRYFLSVT